ncbi:hypothetical protein HPB50_027696 [Hyalomma asiaticum]|nr:hypothetical protein HPB50_027696 [Hyalomma asiaticum]
MVSLPPWRTILEDVCFADHIHVDASAVVGGLLTDDIVRDDYEEEDEAPVRPSATEVMAGLNATRLFLTFEEGKEEAFHHIRSLEQEVLVVAFKEKRQTMIIKLHSH